MLRRPRRAGRAHRLGRRHRPAPRTRTAAAGVAAAPTAGRGRRSATLGPARTRRRALHEVRKAAKRARYAAEALYRRSANGRARMAEVAERVQDALG